jgi:uncharacterized protein YsxB (DUF464 family)
MAHNIYYVEIQAKNTTVNLLLMELLTVKLENLHQLYNGEIHLNSVNNT